MDTTIIQKLKLANTSYQTADHLTFVTYPMVQDMKLMKSVLKHLDDTINYTIDAFLEYEYYYKNISTIPTKIEDKLMIIFNSGTKRHNFDRQKLLLIRDIKDFLKYEQKSKTEFIKKNQLVFADSEFQIKTLNYDRIKMYVQEVKSFLDLISKVIEHVGRIRR